MIKTNSSKNFGYFGFKLTPMNKKPKYKSRVYYTSERKLDLSGCKATTTGVTIENKDDVHTDASATVKSKYKNKFKKGNK